MDRHLKERMVGAVVLVAAANILIPPMLSGPRHAPTSSEAPSANITPTPSDDVSKLKTYTIDLAKPAAAIPTSEVTQAPIPEIAQASRSPDSKTAAALPAPAPEVAPPEVLTGSKLEPKQEVSKTEAAKVSQSQTRDDVAVRLPPTKAVPTSSSIAPDSSGGWTVQVGSFGVRGTSERVAADLKRSGFSAFVVAFQSGNQTMYRVRVGPERDRAAAEGLLHKLKAQHPNAAVVPPP